MSIISIVYVPEGIIVAADSRLTKNIEKDNDGTKTIGGFIGDNNFGFDYVRALATGFFGIDNVRFFSAEGLDIYGADVDQIMKKAKENMLFQISNNK